MGRPPLLSSQPGQSILHLLSAISFVCAYALMFNDPAMAALIGWLVSMTSRQVGHFFFEPKDYDVVNQATHEYKEEIKVGYNLRRKVVLMAVWALSPLILVLDPRCWDFSRRIAGEWILPGTSDICGLLSGWAAWPSGHCSYSSSRMCRQDWSGRPRSSPIRSTISSYTIRRRCSF